MSFIRVGTAVVNLNNVTFIEKGLFSGARIYFLSDGGCLEVGNTPSELFDEIVRKENIVKSKTTGTVSYAVRGNVTGQSNVMEK